MSRLDFSGASAAGDWNIPLLDEPAADYGALGNSDVDETIAGVELSAALLLGLSLVAMGLPGRKGRLEKRLSSVTI